MASKLLNESKKNLQGPKSEGIITSFLGVSGLTGLIDITEKIFSDPVKKQEFLDSYQKEVLRFEKSPENKEVALCEMEELLKNEATKEQDMRAIFNNRTFALFR